MSRRRGHISAIAADIFCSPSVWEEGFGLVNVEAFASGVPVVATHSGGVQEILSNGGGILVERGSVVQLAGALRRLAQDPELRMRMGRQGYAVFGERLPSPCAKNERYFRRLKTGGEPHAKRVGKKTPFLVHNLISGVDGQEGNNLGEAMLQGLLGEWDLDQHGLRRGVGSL